MTANTDSVTAAPAATVHSAPFSYGAKHWREELRDRLADYRTRTGGSVDGPRNDQPGAVPGEPGNGGTSVGAQTSDGGAGAVSNSDPGTGGHSANVSDGATTPRPGDAGGAAVTDNGEADMATETFTDLTQKIQRDLDEREKRKLGHALRSALVTANCPNVENYLRIWSSIEAKFRQEWEMIHAGLAAMPNERRIESMKLQASVSLKVNEVNDGLEMRFEGAHTLKTAPIKSSAVVRNGQLELFGGGRAKTETDAPSDNDTPPDSEGM